MLEDPDRNPVHLNKMYADKRPNEMGHDDSPFFLTPSASPTALYKKCALGINKSYAIMKEMKKSMAIELRLILIICKTCPALYCFLVTPDPENYI